MIHEFMDRFILFAPKLWEALGETSIMMTLAASAALALGFPLGTIMFLTAEGHPVENIFVNRLLNLVVNIIRSFPFLLLVVAMQPAVRALYGRATGDPVAASFPLMTISVALYARFVEQAFMDLGKPIIETAQAMGASTSQLVRYFLFTEAKGSLVIGFTTALVSFLSYSTVMGVVGGGGIGDFAIRYGYQRYENDIMFTAIVLMIIIVQFIQWAGFRLAHYIDKRYLVKE